MGHAYRPPHNRLLLKRSQQKQTFWPKQPAWLPSTQILARSPSSRACRSRIRACRGRVRVSRSRVRACRSRVRACRSRVRACRSHVRVCRGRVRACRSRIRACRGRVRSVAVAFGSVAVAFGSVGAAFGSVGAAFGPVGTALQPVGEEFGSVRDRDSDLEAVAPELSTGVDVCGIARTRSPHTRARSASRWLLLIAGLARQWGGGRRILWNRLQQNLTSA